MGKTQRLVVIGGVAAGATAAAKAKRTNPNLEVIVLERGRHISYAACGIPAFVAGLIPNADNLIARTPAEFAKRGVEVRTQHEVLEIDAWNKSLRVADLVAARDYSLSYDSLVIATGADATRPPLPGANLPGIITVRTLTDGLAVYELVRAKPPRSIVICGGGYTGLVMADAFRARGLPVTVVELLPQLMVNLDTEMSDLLRAEMERQGVRVLLNDGVVRFEGIGHVAKVITPHTEIPADLVLLALGVRPNTKLAQQVGLHLGAGRAIAVDDHMRTSVDGIHAAGDCVDTVHQVTGEKVYLPLGTTANKQGRVAGANAAGMDCTFTGVAGTAVVKVFGLEVARTGLSEKEATAKGFSVNASRITAKDRAGYYPGATRLDVKLVIDSASRRLLGGQIIGAQGAAKRIDLLAAAIYAKLSVDDLTHIDYSYTPAVASVLDATLVAANVVSRCQ